MDRGNATNCIAAVHTMNLLPFRIPHSVSTCSKSSPSFQDAALRSTKARLANEYQKCTWLPLSHSRRHESCFHCRPFVLGLINVHEQWKNHYFPDQRIGALEHRPKAIRSTKDACMRFAKQNEPQREDIIWWHACRTFLQARARKHIFSLGAYGAMALLG